MSRAKSSSPSPATPAPSSRAPSATPEELAERQRLGRRYEASQELAKIREGIRGHRIAVNTLIREEKKLQAREEELKQIMKEGRE